MLTGQKPEPAFLVTKPFMPDMLKAIIGQALFFDTRAIVAKKSRLSACSLLVGRGREQTAAACVLTP